LDEVCFHFYIELANQVFHENKGTLEDIYEYQLFLTVLLDFGSHPGYAFISLLSQRGL